MAELTLAEKKKRASELRKQKNFEEALVFYKDLWGSEGDNYDAWGLLHCLRKLKRFDEALANVDSVRKKYPKDEWCAIEIGWILIQGVFLKLDDNTPLSTIISEANNILNLNPGDLAKRFVAFRVLKFIKKNTRWDLADHWLSLIDPTSLDEKPISESFGPRGWSYKVLWYNYKLKTLLETGKFDEVLILSDEIVAKFPAQNKYILRFKALALHKLGKDDQSLDVYSKLTNGFRGDWWLLYEYALVLKSKNKEAALTMMYRATNGNPKLELMVTAFIGIGDLLKELERNDDALAHFLLSKFIRLENDWKITSELESAIETLIQKSTIKDKVSNKSDALRYCKELWKKKLESDGEDKKEKGPVKTKLSGVVSLGDPSKSFCFINVSKNESYFCLKKDMPTSVRNGDRVVFDVIPSFDAKKGKESLRAKSVRLSSKP